MMAESTVRRPWPLTASVLTGLKAPTPARSPSLGKEICVEREPMIRALYPLRFK